MRLTLLAGAAVGLAGVLGAGCVAPNLNPFEEPTDRELAAMVNRRAAFDESPYGPYGAPTGEEMAATRARQELAHWDRQAVAAWMELDDPAWTGQPHALVPGQAQWLTAVEARVIGTQPWERGAAMAAHLRMDWMRDQEARAARANDIREALRARRAPYGGFATDFQPHPDSEFAEDGFPGYTVHERQAWRIHWGYGVHHWNRDARPPLLWPIQAQPGPATHPASGTPEFGEMQPPNPVDEPKQPAGDTKPAEKKKPTDEKKPADKKSSGSF